MIIIITSVLILSLLIIYLIIKNISPILFKYASFDIKKIVGNIITDSIEQNYNSSDLYTLKYDKNGNIILLDFDSVKANKMLFNISRTVQNNLKKIEIGESVKLKHKVISEGIICKIPLSVLFGKKLYFNLGPKIPIKINLIGDVSSRLDNQIKDYGINNALIEVSVIIDISIQMLFPYNSQILNINNKTPISIKLVQGNVPDLYNTTN